MYISSAIILSYYSTALDRIFTGIPHPFIGPKGIRLLLCLRGFSGYVSICYIHILASTLMFCSRSFFGLFGIYYSLQYLSLADATVLTFLAPLTTGIAGSIFLGEIFTTRQAFASRESCGLIFSWIVMID